MCGAGTRREQTGDEPGRDKPRKRTNTALVSPASAGRLLPPMDGNHLSPTLATQKRTHFREPVVHLTAGSSLPSRDLVNPGNSWAEAEEASFISISAVDSMLGAQLQWPRNPEGYGDLSNEGSFGAKGLFDLGFYECIGVFQGEGTRGRDLDT